MLCYAYMNQSSMYQYNTYKYDALLFTFWLNSSMCLIIFPEILTNVHNIANMRQLDADNLDTLLLQAAWPASWRLPLLADCPSCIPFQSGRD